MKNPTRTFISLIFFVFSSLVLSAEPEVKYAATYLRKKDFESLERVFSELQTMYRAGRIDDEILYNHYEKFAESLNDGDENFINEWVKSEPGSYQARTARGYYFISKGWRIRGKYYVSQTLTEQLGGFKEYLTKATDDLLKSAELEQKSTPSYLALIRVAGALSSPQNTKLMRDKALALDPYSVKARQLYLNYAAPKWGGTIALLDQALAEAEKAAIPVSDKARIRAAYFFEVAEYFESSDNASEALEYLWRAIKVNDPKSKTVAYNKAIALAKKTRLFDQALKLLSAMILEEKQLVWALNQRGYIYESQYAQLDKAFEDYVSASKLGDAWAENKIGFWYLNGIFVKKDLEIAETYLRRSAQKNNVSAVGNLKRLEREKAGLPPQ